MRPQSETASSRWDKLVAAATTSFGSSRTDVMSPTPHISGLPTRVRVWDVPTRVSHWLMVLTVALSWWSASSHQMEWHRYSGFALLGVLVFRLYWGLVGSHTARFARFVKGPSEIWRYLRASSWHATPGHNPLGALSVMALLALLISQVVLGL